MDNQITLYNATTAQQVYDLVAAGHSVNDIIIKNEYVYTPLHSACDRDNLEVVKAICESGISIEYLNKGPVFEPIIFACRNDNLEMVKYLISKGESIYTALECVCYSGYEDIFDYILTLKPDLNKLDDCQESLLFLTCWERNLNIIEKLLINGANPNICEGKYEMNCLMVLFYPNNIPYLSHISKLLIMYGVNYYHIDNRGLSVLHHFSCNIYNISSNEVNDRIDALRFLVGMGCNINLKDNEGNTPLFYMQRCIYFKIIKTFLQLGADITIANNYGKTLLTCADKITKRKINNYFKKNKL